MIKYKLWRVKQRPKHTFDRSLTLHDLLQFLAQLQRVFDLRDVVFGKQPKRGQFSESEPSLWPGENQIRSQLACTINLAARRVVEPLAFALRLNLYSLCRSARKTPSGACCPRRHSSSPS